MKKKKKRASTKMGHIIHFGEALIANFHETHYSTQVHRYYMTISTCVSKKEFK